MSGQTKKLPFVLFLDVDRTLIGRANALAAHHCLQRVLQELADAGELPRTACLLAAESDTYREELVRPGMGTSLRRLREGIKKADGHDALEIFVCSLGQASLVAERKVPLIEAVAGVRFNRPLFSASSKDDENCQATGDPKKKLVRQCFRTAIQSLLKKGSICALATLNILYLIYLTHGS